MSLLMKALQQAAQNRGDGPAQAAADAGTPEAGPTRDAAAAGASPAIPGPADTGLPGELSLEPIDAAGSSSAAGGNRRPAGEAAQRAAALRGDPSIAAPRIEGARRPAPGLDSRIDILDSADSPDDRDWRGPAHATAAGPARNTEAGARQRPASRSTTGAAISQGRAGAILAAGAGAVKPGRLSQITRLQWIILAGLAAGLALFVYFYIQIAHPGLLQRGLRSTQLLAQPAPPSPSPVPAPAPTTSIPPASTTSGPSTGLISGEGQLAATTGSPPILPAPAGVSTGAAPSIPMTGVPPVAPAPQPAAAPPAPGIPEALSASPLLNSQVPGTHARAGAVPPATSAPVPTSSATAAPATSAAPSAAPPPSAATSQASPAPRQPATAGDEMRSAQPARSSNASPARASSRDTPGAAAAPAAPGNRRDRAVRPAAEPAGIQVTRGSAVDPVNPVLTQAWEHLQAGRTDTASALYQQVIAGEPRNIDALLGLAAILQLENQNEAATRQYLRVLELDPRNSHAQASLIGLLGRADPTAAESRLKLLIDREPSPFLYFTLGNLYADQNRWPLAQQAFFQAHHLQPGNADYAFNLAVGLERISQQKLALSYLRTAVTLADAGARASFDVAAARKRVLQLESAAALQ